MKWPYWLGVAIFVVIGVSTLVPAPSNQPNLLGYNSVDPFSPISGIVLWLIAGLIYWFGKKKEKTP